MKSKILLAVTVGVAVASSAWATPELRLSDGTTTITVVDGDSNDQSTDPGVVYYNGPVGPNWTVNITIGVTKPEEGSPAEPYMDLDTTSLSTKAGDLQIDFSDTDFTASSGTFDAAAGGTTDGSVEFKYYLDGSNTPFGTNVTLADFPNQVDVYAASSNGTFNITAPYSMTVEALIHHNGRGSTGFDSSIQLTPPQYQPPTIQCAGDTDLGCNPPVIPSCDTNSITVNASCGVSNITCAAAGPDSVTGCVHERDLVYTVTDNCGLSASCTQHIYWTVDNTPPTFNNCPGDRDLGCNPPSIPDCSLDVTASDDCSPKAVVTCSSADATNGCSYTRTVTYVATDKCGNKATCVQHITWTIDTIAPTFTTCPADRDLGCNPSSIPDCDISTAAATDNCTANPTITCSSSDNADGCVHTRTITYVATDACGNTATCVQHLRWIVSTAAPVFTTMPTNMDLGCNPATIPDCDASQVAATAACGSAKITCSKVDSGTSCNKTRVITYVATDACGNTASATQTITWVADTTPPVITCPPAKITNCLPYCTFSRSNWCQSNGGNNGCWYLNSCFMLMYGWNGCQIGVTNGGHYLRCTSGDYCRANCNYSYGCGRLDRDCVNPTSCSAGSFTSHCLALKLNVDFCDFGAKWGICSPIGDCVLHDDSSPCNGKKVRDILDLCNKAIGGCDISWSGCTISDLTNICEKINNSCDNWKCSSWATCHLLPHTCTNNTGVATAVDDCDPHPTITYTDVNTTPDCGGSSVTRIWTATDKCGNTSTCAQQISSYSDKTPPVFTKCASDIDLGCNPTTIPGCDVTQVTAIDNCGTPTVTCTSSDSVYGCSAKRTIVYTATDASGNKSSCVQHITWTVDTIPPVITCPPSTATYCKPYCTYSRTNWCGTPNGYNCASILTNCYSKIYGYNGCKVGGQSWGSYSLTCNSASAVRYACKITGSPDRQDCSLVNPTSCKSAVFGANCFALKLNVDYCDYASQSGTCSKIGDCVLDDNTLPCNGMKVRDILNVCHTALGGGDISSYGCTISQLNDLCEKINHCCEDGQPNTWATCHLLPTCCKSNGYATATDNCDSNVAITYNDVVSAGSCSGGTVTTRIWTATDNCGNVSTCSQVLTMSACPPPVVSCPSTCSAKLNYSYSSSFKATGGTGSYTFSIISGKLPPGLTLNASTGAITGKPTCTGSYCFTVQVKDSAGGVDTENCCITVSYY